MPKYIQITASKMDTFLVDQGFLLLPDIPGVTEKVYSKLIAKNLCIRVYSTVQGKVSRNIGTDAIRVCLVSRKKGNTISILYMAKRVHRVVNWQVNLQNRIDTCKDNITPQCPECNSYTVLRKSKYGSFYGCINYPECKGTVNIPLPDLHKYQRDTSKIPFISTEVKQG